MADSLDSDILAIRGDREQREAMQFFREQAAAQPTGAPPPATGLASEAAPAETPDDPGILSQAAELIKTHPTVRAIGALLEADQKAGQVMKLGHTPEEIGEDVLGKTVPIVGEKAGGVLAFTMDEAATLFTPLGVATFGAYGLVKGAVQGVKRGLELGEPKLATTARKADEAGTAPKPQAEPVAASPAPSQPMPLVSEASAAAKDAAILDKTFGHAQAQAFRDIRAKVEAKAKLTKQEKATFEQMKEMLPKAHPDPFVVDVGGKLLRIDVDQLTDANSIAEATDKVAAFIKQHKVVGDELITLQGGARPIPDAITKTIGEQLGVTPDDLLNLSRSEGVAVEQVYAAALITQASFQRLTQTGKMFQAGLLNEDAFMGSFSQHLFVSNAFESKITQGAQVTRQAGIGVTKQAFRSGRQLKEEMAAAQQTAENLGKMALSADELAAIIGKVDAATFASALKKAKTSGLDFIPELIYGSILSNPATHVTNLAGSLLITPSVAIMERYLAAVQPWSAVTIREANSMIYGYVNGVGRAFHVVADSYRNTGFMNLADDLATGTATKLDVFTPPAISSTRLPASLRDGLIGHTVDALGAIVRAPSAFLRVSDVVMRGVNADMGLHALAVREGVRRDLSGSALDGFVERTVRNPPPAMLKEAEQFGRVQTFTQELEGRLGAIQQGLNHPLMTAVVPFIRTPTNIFRYELERVPVLNLFLKSVREDITAGGVRRDLALSKMALGTAVGTVAASLAMNGKITGGGPQQPGVRAVWLKTHKPYSIKTDAGWISYNRLDPVAGWMGAVADAVGMSGETDADTRGGVALAITMGFAKNFTSKTYAKDVAQFIDLFTVSGHSQDTKAKQLEKYLEGRAKILIPAGLAAANKAFFDPNLHEVRTWLDVIQSRVLGWSASLPLRRDPLFGEPIVSEGGVGPDLFSPLPIQQAVDDKVADELVTLRVGLELPKYLDKVELDGKASEQLTLAFTQNKIINDLNLHDYLAAVMATDFYQQSTDGPFGGRAEQLKGVIAGYRAAAIESLKSTNKDVGAQVSEKKAQKFERKTGQRPLTVQ